MDIDALKREYITTKIGVRELAAKHNVPYGTLRKRAERGKWAQERARMDAEAAAGRAQAARDVAREMEYEEYKGLLEAAGLLSDKIYAAVELMSAEDILRDKRGLRSLTGAIKDLADVQGFKTDADRREQEARIRSLERQSETQQPESINVVINGADGYCER